MATLSDAERRAWWRLSRTQNVGPVTFAHLLSHCGSASAALEAVPKLARRGGNDTLRIPTDADAKREFDATAKLNGKIILSCDPDFPAGLVALDPPPPLLYAIGNLHLLRRDMVAIVGARNASALARKLAHQLAADLSAAKLVVASGMARGIDTAAHEGALANGTCAVLAGGIDVIYPPENDKLYERLREQGVIVSEMPLGQAPQARHFPRRNRIISGLSRGVVVVEAAEGSGSLITANYALEQGREVFAVPGSPLDPRAKGTNKLLRDGATLTETADDVLAVIGPMLADGFREPDRDMAGGKVSAKAEAEADHVRKQVEECLGPAGVTVDEIIRLTGAPASAVQIVLLELELAGRVSRQPGNLVSWA